jgi:hypothetical protein
VLSKPEQDEQTKAEAPPLGGPNDAKRFAEPESADKRRTDVKRVSLLTIVALLGLLMAAPAVQAAPSAGRFAGNWEATDFDGSALHAYIFGSGQIRWTDNVASSACEGLDDQSWESFLTGKVHGNELNSTMKWSRCGSGPARAPETLGLTWYLDDQGDGDRSNDVLTNDFGEVYARVP